MGHSEKLSTFPLIGCGILRDEISFLIEKNHWALEAHYLSSSLHVDFDKLENNLVHSLKHYGADPKLVFYGTCHPNIKRFIDQGNAVRTDGQNCVDILLGHVLFEQYLSKGAFFLMEDWVRHWDNVMFKAFGRNPEIIREILSSEHNFLLGLRTPCSSDFSREAEKIAESIDLPLKWLDVSLDHLESTLENALKNVIKKTRQQCK